MIQIKRILCPYDFSEYADEALNYALRLADSETQIVLLNVIQLPYIVDPSGFTYSNVDLEVVTQVAEDALITRVSDLGKKYPELKITFAVEVDDDPADAILKAQHAGVYDLMVIGSHGRKGLGRLLMGSVSESVLREATCPVMIIKKN